MDTASASFFQRLKSRLPKLPLIVWLIILFIFAMVISAGIYIAISPDISLKSLFSKIFPPQENQVIWEPYTPSPRPLAHGMQTYNISGSTQGAPKITQAVIDPLDPAKGSSQKWTLKILEPNGRAVTEVSVTVLTDKEQQKISLKKVSGTDQDGTWEGSGVITDSYEHNYQAALFAKNDAGLSQVVTLTFR